MGRVAIMQLPVIQPGQQGSATRGETPVFPRIGIVGLGLIGGSIALAARQIWPASLVIAVDNKDVLETAMRLHAIDVAADDPIVLAEADLVILAAPVQQNLAILEELDANVHQPAVITDTGSTKRSIVEAAARLPARFTFVGGHPLGGGSVSGLEHARPDLFVDRQWIFTPAGDATGEALERLFTFATALGAAPRVMTAAAHDRLMAFVSHLPQLTASALMQTVGEAAGVEGLELAGRGLVDTTRLAASRSVIWRDIGVTNADEIGVALDALIGLLQDLRADLGSGARLADVFDAAREWRTALMKDRPQSHRLCLPTVRYNAPSPYEQGSEGRARRRRPHPRWRHHPHGGIRAVRHSRKSHPGAARAKAPATSPLISNNAGVDGFGIGVLLEARQVRKMISTYVGENKEFERQFLTGEIEVELVPQGTFSERIRAAGAGIGGFFTPTAYGTLVAEGKETRVIDGKPHVLEGPLGADFAFVHAWKGDRLGNLVYRRTARNFNPVMATAARVTIAEVEHLVEPGAIDPDHVITPGIFVKHILQGARYEKRIEKRTVR